ncbi:hypothetical protein [Curtobacterium sp. ISL-83]|uniref:hypothetical protein n=1 Tax=Curtobacterium sp. ISL-83 TaxID=2819145 RepID=UPI001BEB9D11|nr:hypothetical protein [Curtobacterium sp. ISL-83]MBT2501102.1 hypothetical protein [Curtobacterium sp. ISL-83]
MVHVAGSSSVNRARLDAGVGVRTGAAASIFGGVVADGVDVGADDGDRDGCTEAAAAVVFGELIGSAPAWSVHAVRLMTAAVATATLSARTRWRFRRVVLFVMIFPSTPEVSRKRQS